MSEGSGHLWVTGAGSTARRPVMEAVRPDATGDCHRRRYGPYTGVGTVLRTLVPRLWDEHSDELVRHAKEILAVAPELHGRFGEVGANLTVSVPVEERTRWFPVSTSRRQSHGLIDLLRTITATGPALTLAFDSVHAADPTDQEFLALALRRLDPARVRLVLGAADGEVPAELAAARSRYAREVGAPDPAAASDAALDPVEAARAFVASDGTSDDPALAAGYERCAPQVRAALHDERIAELTVHGPAAARFGALPWHWIHGGRPISEAQVDVAVAASECIGNAYYAAALHLIEPVLPLVDPVADPTGHYYLELLAAQCLGALDRPAETEAIYWDLLSRTNSARAHMSLYYALGIVYTRIHGPEHKDHQRARAFMNTAIEIAKLLPEAKDRAFHTVFMSNGKALVEMHLREPRAALTLVEDGIAALDEALAPDEHRLHRSVLHHNRSQLLASLGRFDEALTDLDHVVSVDPRYPEYRFDRGNVRCRQGRPAEAVADYDDAARLGPPFPELFHNRAQARADSGDLAGAVADFGYVLDLEPDYLESRISLSALLLEAGDAQAAATVAAEGVALTPDQARLHCSHGLALLELDQPQQAAGAFDRALELEPELTAARVNRAIADFQQERFDRALADLTAVLDGDVDNPDLLYNRGFVHEALQQWERAVADYSLALEAEAADRVELLFRRAHCLTAAGRHEEADADLREHRALVDSTDGRVRAAR